MIEASQEYQIKLNEKIRKIYSDIHRSDFAKNSPSLENMDMHQKLGLLSDMLKHVEEKGVMRIYMINGRKVSMSSKPAIGNFNNLEQVEPIVQEEAIIEEIKKLRVEIFDAVVSEIEKSPAEKRQIFNELYSSLGNIFFEDEEELHKRTNQVFDLAVKVTDAEYANESLTVRIEREINNSYFTGLNPSKKLQELERIFEAIKMPVNWANFTGAEIEEKIQITKKLKTLYVKIVKDNPKDAKVKEIAEKPSNLIDFNKTSERKQIQEFYNDLNPEFQFKKFISKNFGDGRQGNDKAEKQDTFKEIDLRTYLKDKKPAEKLKSLEKMFEHIKENKGLYTYAGIFDLKNNPDILTSTQQKHIAVLKKVFIEILEDDIDNIPENDLREILDKKNGLVDFNNSNTSDMFKSKITGTRTSANKILEESYHKEEQDKPILEEKKAGYQSPQEIQQYCVNILTEVKNTALRTKLKVIMNKETGRYRRFGEDLKEFVKEINKGLDSKEGLTDVKYMRIQQKYSKINAYYNNLEIKEFPSKGYTRNLPDANHSYVEDFMKKIHEFIQGNAEKRKDLNKEKNFCIREFYNVKDYNLCRELIQKVNIMEKTGQFPDREDLKEFVIQINEKIDNGSLTQKTYMELFNKFGNEKSGRAMIKSCV